MPDETQRVAAHYARADLGEAILAALRAAGKDPDALSPDDLAPLDQFHFRGLDRIRIDRTHIVGSIDPVNPVYTYKVEQIHGR